MFTKLMLMIFMVSLLLSSISGLWLAFLYFRDNYYAIKDMVEYFKNK